MKVFEQDNGPFPNLVENGSDAMYEEHVKSLLGELDQSHSSGVGRLKCKV